MDTKLFADKKDNTQTDIKFFVKEYLILVDTSGRIQRAGKRGFIPLTFKPILQRPETPPSEWFNNIQNMMKTIGLILTLSEYHLTSLYNKNFLKKSFRSSQNWSLGALFENHSFAQNLSQKQEGSKNRALNIWLFSC